MSAKLKIGDIIFFIDKNQVHSAPILSILTVENNEDLAPANMEQSEVFRQFCDTRIQYATIHGIVNSQNVFPSKEELIKSL